MSTDVYHSSAGNCRVLKRIISFFLFSSSPSFTFCFKLRIHAQLEKCNLLTLCPQNATYIMGTWCRFDVTLWRKVYSKNAITYPFFIDVVYAAAMTMSTAVR